MNKGVILAGGTGTRLSPLTKVTNKHLLPIYNAPMIMYPLNTLIDSGIDDIIIITGKEHCGSFIELLGSEYNEVELTYRVQEKAGGIAEGLGLCKNFIGDDNFVVLLSDNIFEDTFDFRDFEDGARVYLKKVDNPQRFGVANLDCSPVLGCEKGCEKPRLIEIEEKPKEPKSNYAVTGLYLYDSGVFDIIKSLKPSERGEMEISDVNNWYIRQGLMDYRIVKGFWSDAGTFSSLFNASEFMKNKEER